MDSNFIKLEKTLIDAAGQAQHIKRQIREDHDLAFPLLEEFLNILEKGVDEMNRIKLPSFEAVPKEMCKKMRQATQEILNLKEIDKESGGVVVAALLGSEQYKPLLSRLEDLREFLKRGERAEAVDLDGAHP